VRIPALVDLALQAEANRRSTTATDLIVRALIVYLGAARLDDQRPALRAPRPPMPDDDGWADLLGRIDTTTIDHAVLAGRI
jgi:hypothetical protein